MNGRRPWAARRALLALAATAALLLPAVPAQAAPFGFDSASATSTFNQGIEFSVRLSLSAAPSRVEIHLQFPGELGPFVVTLPDQPPAGTTTLHYTLDTSGAGHMMPNSPVTVTWEAYPQPDGQPIVSAPFTYRYLDETQAWKTLRDGIVTVHWVNGPQSLAQNAASVAVKALQNGAAALGITETEPVDFFIYGDDASFRAALGAGTRENVAGEAVTEIRTLFAEVTPDQVNDPYNTVVVTHELTHQVVDDATHNPYRSLPRWLNEGFAVYMSEGFSPRFRSALSDAVSSHDLLPLTALGWQFPTNYDKTTLAYAESVSAVDYLAHQYGTDALAKLILAYKDGPTDDEAMQAAIGKPVAVFQAEWFASIGAATPSPFGPQPAPPGPLPSDWTGAIATPGPSAAPTNAPATEVPSAGAPSASAPAPSPTTAPAPGGDASSVDLVLVLVAVMLVSAAVLAGIVITSRRSSA